MRTRDLRKKYDTIRRRSLDCTESAYHLMVARPQDAVAQFFDDVEPDRTKR